MKAQIGDVKPETLEVLSWKNLGVFAFSTLDGRIMVVKFERVDGDHAGTLSYDIQAFNMFETLVDADNLPFVWPKSIYVDSVNHVAALFMKRASWETLRDILQKKPLDTRMLCQYARQLVKVLGLRMKSKKLIDDNLWHIFDVAGQIHFIDCGDWEDKGSSYDVEIAWAMFDNLLELVYLKNTNNISIDDMLDFWEFAVDLAKIFSLDKMFKPFLDTLEKPLGQSVVKFWEQAIAQQTAQELADFAGCYLNSIKKSREGYDLLNVTCDSPALLLRYIWLRLTEKREER